MKYRPDIDGLRAIAVLAVVFYHLHLGFFSGGFVGVDVFFVISGYLVSSIILRDLGKNDFSFLNFVERRIRRIFPAHFFMVAATVVTAWYFLIPSDLKSFGEILFSQSFFLSNIFLMKQAGYFDIPSLSKPLLHTWSLAIEEQFYLLLPLILFISFKIKKVKIQNVIIIFSLLSFGFSIYFEKDSAMAFYLLPSRAWELLAGTILAIFIKNRKFTVLQSFNNLLSATGLIAIFYSIIFFNNDTTFPSYNALIPCLGTLLFLFAGHNGKPYLNRVLSGKFFVGIGLMSYSLYLWHWPIFVFLKYEMMRPLTLAEAGAILIFNFLVAYLSWKYIETPFRNKVRILRNRRQTFVFAGLSLSCFFVIGYVFWKTDLISFPATKESLQYARGAEDGNPRRGACHLINTSKLVENKLCSLGSSTTEDASYLVWGDSHADAIAPAIDGALKNLNKKGEYLSFSGCPPLLGASRSSLNYGLKEECDKYNEAMLARASRDNINNVVLVARWSFYALGEPNEVSEFSRLAIQGRDVISREEGTIAFAKGLNNLIKELEALNVKVWMVRQVPKMYFRPPAVLANYARKNKDVSRLGTPLAGHLKRQNYVNSIIDSLINNNVHAIDPAKFLCVKGNCRVAMNGKSLYKDDDHISLHGAVFLERLFVESFKNIEL